jgi:hypothetical protein
VGVIREAVAAKHGNPFLKPIVGHGLEAFDGLLAEIFSPASVFHHRTPKLDDFVPPVMSCLIGNTVSCQQGEVVDELATMGIWQGLIIYVSPAIFILAKAGMPVGTAVYST